MFRIYKVKAAAGYEVVVDDSIVERTPVRVYKEEQVYFVSFAPLVVEEKTVKNHITRLYSKLNINSRYEAIRYKLGNRT